MAKKLVVPQVTEDQIRKHIGEVVEQMFQQKSKPTRTFNDDKNTVLVPEQKFHEDNGRRLLFSVHSWDGGDPKVQISCIRKNKKTGDEEYAKVGRMSVSEVDAFIAVYSTWKTRKKGGVLRRVTADSK